MFQKFKGSKISDFNLGMVVTCVAYNCKTKFIKGGLSFHSFPTDPVQRKKWTMALRFENFTPSKHSKLCANHFTDDCFKEWLGGAQKRIALKPGSVPTVFDFPKHLQKRVAIRRPPKDRSGNVQVPADELEVEVVEHIEESRQCKAQEERVDIFTVTLPTDSTGQLAKITAVVCEADDESRCEPEAQPICEPAEGQTTFEPESPPTTCEPEARQPLSELKIQPSNRQKTHEFVRDFTSEDMTSPEKAIRFRQLVYALLRKKTILIKKMQLDRKLLKRKVRNLEALVAHCKKQNSIHRDAATYLLDSMPEPMRDLYKQTMRASSTRKMPEQLRAFAIRLHLYSPKAYDFVRRTFKNALPHRGTLTKWCKPVDEAPGSSMEAPTANGTVN